MKKNEKNVKCFGGSDLFSPKIDFVFKLLFGSEQNKDVLVSFLKAVLDIPHEEYQEISLKNTVLSKEHAADKYGVLDVKLKTRSGKVINIEIQVLDVPNYDTRILFYLSKMIGEQISAGQSYALINKTISISVLNFELIHDSINYKNVYRLYDKDTQSTFTDLLEVVTLELSKLPEAFDNTPIFPWLKFIAVKDKEEAMNIVEKYPQLQEVYERLQVLSKSEENRAEYEMRYKWYLDEINILQSREIAQEKALQRGWEKGLSQGLAQGLAQGEQQKAFETARNLLQLGISEAVIMQATGLTSKELLEAFAV